MLILSTWRGQSLTLSFKSNCLTLSLQSGLDSTVFSWDLSGRLWTAMLANVSYRRGLDGKIVTKWQLPSGDRQRRWLSPSEADALLDQASALAAQLLADLESGAFAPAPKPSPQNLAALARAANFDPARAAADVQGYHTVYQPVGILPPDQYMAVVLQPALGCSFNTCTFCNFYRDRRFRIRPPHEFQAHAEAVKNYLGDGLTLRRTLFLGDANALVIPMPRLVPLLQITHSVFDVDSLGGIYAFLDGFSGEKKTPADFKILAQLGLKRVYIGLESGHDPLLRFLKKPGLAIDALHAVRAMKASGVAVGIIVLLGAGGRQFARAHVDDTIHILNRMDLDADDLIYFSELVEDSSPSLSDSALLEYTRDAYAHNLTPLTAAERLDQGEQIESALFFNPDRGVPHISRYDIREFVY